MVNSEGNLAGMEGFDVIGDFGDGLGVGFHNGELQFLERGWR